VPKDPVAEVERSLKRLGVDYVDLYIIHWPEGGSTWAWPAMERARELGHARSIGVSNFGVDELRQLLATATVPAVVDQVQFSPARCVNSSTARSIRSSRRRRPKAFADDT
jgi:2,5-diketo-D-gluconate reductase A